MVRTIRQDWDTFRTDESYGRKDVMKAGSIEGEDFASSDYPHAVYREEQGATREAERVFALWITELEKKVPKHPANFEVERVQRFHSQKGEMKRLFVSGFVSSYLDWIRKEDARRAPQTQQVPTNTITVGGATFTVKKIDRNADEVIYYLEINHPGVTEGSTELELVTPINRSISLQELANEANNILKNRGELPS